MTSFVRHVRNSPPCRQTSMRPSGHQCARVARMATAVLLVWSCGLGGVCAQAQVTYTVDARVHQGSDRVDGVAEITLPTGADLRFWLYAERLRTAPKAMPSRDARKIF